MSLRLTTYIPHDPTARQAAFLAWNGREAFYGGAAGGGKSDALLMGALQYADVPGYTALLLRRTFRELRLPGGLMDRSHDWLAPTDARWSVGDSTWHFPSTASLTFGYLEHGERDRARYQGAEFQYVGFDELTHFEEADYRFLFTRLRRLASVEVPIRMRSASNPGGRGHEWVKQRFLVERKPDRIFIPARLADNPYLDREEYARTLMEVDPITRARMLDGDWDVRPGGSIFHREWFKLRDEAPRMVRMVRYWDLASSAADTADFTVGALLGIDAEGQVWILDIVRIRATAHEVERTVRATTEADGWDVTQIIEQEPGASGVMLVDYFRRKVLFGYTVKAGRPTVRKELRAAPFAAQAEGGNVFILARQWTNTYLDELTAFTGREQDVDHDDQVDASSGAFETIAVRRSRTLSVAE